MIFFVALALGGVIIVTSVSAAPRYERLGEDPAESHVGPDLLYLDVARKGDSLKARFGLSPDEVVSGQPSFTSLYWHFSVERTYRTFFVRIYLDQKEFRLFESSETDSENCAEHVAALNGSSDPESGIVSVSIPLDLIQAKPGDEVGTINYNECYEALPEVRAYHRIWLDRVGDPVNDRTDEIEIEKTYVIPRY